MKRKRLTIPAIILGVLVLLIILIWPAAPLWARLGFEPFCIQGSLPNLKFVPCGKTATLQPVITPLPLPTPFGDTPIPLIFDDDGSPDGMIALMYFLRNPLFEVKAVTISSGEAHPDIFAPLLQDLLAGFGIHNIPIGAGRLTPLDGNNAFPKPWRDASDDFWGRPHQTILKESPPAAQLIVDVINRSSQPVMIFVGGTHTNLAEALRLNPEIVKKIRSVHIMGGAIHVAGNIKSDWPEIDNSIAEWNIWVDPVAADEVFASAVEIHLVPLDATNDILWTDSDITIWSSSGTQEGELAGALLKWMLDSWSVPGAYVWDLVAAILATDPSLCPAVSLAVDILVAPGMSQGKTFITNQHPNVSVCLDPDPIQMRALAATVLGRRMDK